MDTAAITDRERTARGRLGITLRSKWHLDTLLGIGGIAAVYAATHRNGKRGAVKIMHPTACDPDTRQRFLREGRIANHVQHDGIVNVLDDDVSEDGSPFLVMELLDGEPFSARAARTGNKLTADVVLLLTDQVLDALAAAHDKGIVHRDIKPENLFVTTDARVKVLDFGIAHLAEPLETQLRATQHGAAMGTPAFMPPEQARGRWDLVGPESDLWSLGATMFTLLSGEFVHEEESLHELLAATITKPARSLATALPGAPASIVELVDRALQMKIADRWDDAREMQAAVRAAYQTITGQEMPCVQARRSSPGPDESGPRVVVANRQRSTVTGPSSTISSVATQLAAGTPLARQRGSVVIGALAVAAVVAAFMTLRSSASAPVAAAQFSQSARLVEPRIEPRTTPTAAAAGAAIEPALEPAVATAIATTNAGARRTPVTSATPMTVIAAAVPTATPAPSTATVARRLDHNPKALFDRRR